MWLHLYTSVYVYKVGATAHGEATIISLSEVAVKWILKTRVYIGSIIT